jgi:hypothetical protein
VSTENRPLREIKDTDSHMSTPRRRPPLHRVLPGRSLLLLALFALVVASLATAAFRI